MKAIISKCFRQNTVLCLSFLFLFHIASAQEKDPPFQCKIVEEMPEFPGGPTALLKYISTNLKYTENNDEDLCNRIVAKFVVNTSGKTGQIKIIRGCNNAELEDAVIKLIEAMPAWKPGKSNRTIVDCDYILPININLKE